jgi:hypothetical protein
MRVDGVPDGVVAAVGCAVLAVNGVEEVVVGCGLGANVVADLVERHVLRVGEGHGVAQIQV